MAIAFRSGSGVTNAGTGTAVSLTAGTRSAGDLLLVVVATDTDQNFTGKPTGWKYSPWCGGLSGESRFYSFYRIADGTSADNFAGTLNASDDWAVAMAGYSGVDQYTPFQDQNGAAPFTASSSRANPFSSRSGVNGGVLVDLWGMTGTSTGTSYSGVNSANFTKRAEDFSTSAVVAIWDDFTTVATASPASNPRSETFATGGSMTGGAACLVLLPDLAAAGHAIMAQRPAGNWSTTSPAASGSISGNVWDSDPRSWCGGMKFFLAIHIPSDTITSTAANLLDSTNAVAMTLVQRNVQSGTDNTTLEVWYGSITDENITALTQPTVWCHGTQSATASSSAALLIINDADGGFAVRGTPIEAETTTASTTITFPTGIECWNQDTVLAALGSDNKTSMSITVPPTGFTDWGGKGNTGGTTSWVQWLYQIDVTALEDATFDMTTGTAAISNQWDTVAFAVQASDAADPTASPSGGAAMPNLTTTAAAHL